MPSKIATFSRVVWQEDMWSCGQISPKRGSLVHTTRAQEQLKPVQIYYVTNRIEGMGFFDLFKSEPLKRFQSCFDSSETIRKWLLHLCKVAYEDKILNSARLVFFPDRATRIWTGGLYSHRATLAAGGITLEHNISLALISRICPRKLPGENRTNRRKDKFSWLAIHLISSDLCMSSGLTLLVHFNPNADYRSLLTDESWMENKQDLFEKKTPSCGDLATVYTL